MELTIIIKHRSIVLHYDYTFDTLVKVDKQKIYLKWHLQCRAITGKRLFLYSSTTIFTHLKDLKTSSTAAHISKNQTHNSTVKISYPPIFPHSLSSFLSPSFRLCSHVFYHSFYPQKGILTRYQNKNLYLIWAQLQSKVGCTRLLSPERVFFIK